MVRAMVKQGLVIAISCAAVLTAAADTLELADGTILEGDLVGTSNGIIMFDVGGSIQAYPESQVVGIFLSSGVATREAAAEAASTVLTVPAGTRLLIRMSDSIDSRRHGAGHRFNGQLEAALVVDGVTVVPRGTLLYGRVTEGTTSGRLAGSASLQIGFHDMLLNDQLVEIRTAELRAQGSSEAARTVGRTARAAAIGGMVSGSSGARTGAKVGAGASILTSGSSLSVPAGTLLETELLAPIQVEQ